MHPPHRNISFRSNGTCVASGLALDLGGLPVDLVGSMMWHFRPGLLACPTSRTAAPLPKFPHPPPQGAAAASAVASAAASWESKFFSQCCGLP